MLKAKKNIRQSLLHPTKFAAEGGENDEKVPIYKNKWLYVGLVSVIAVIIIVVCSMGGGSDPATNTPKKDDAS